MRTSEKARLLEDTEISIKPALTQWSPTKKQKREMQAICNLWSYTILMYFKCCDSRAGVCVCVCVCERERERERVCLCILAFKSPQARDQLY